VPYLRTNNVRYPKLLAAFSFFPSSDTSLLRNITTLPFNLLHEGDHQVTEQEENQKKSIVKYKQFKDNK
jgi:hypothetical protein